MHVKPFNGTVNVWDLCPTWMGISLSAIFCLSLLVRGGTMSVRVVVSWSCLLDFMDLSGIFLLVFGFICVCILSSSIESFGGKFCSHSPLLFRIMSPVNSSNREASWVCLERGVLWKLYISMVKLWGKFGWGSKWCSTRGLSSFVLDRAMRCSRPLSFPHLLLSPWYLTSLFTSLQLLQVKM